MEVMIVDDEPVARRSVRECCEREPDLKVVGEFGDPGAALEAIRRQPPQLLFLDIQMDSMSGLALARALDPLSLPLIVFVTAYDQYALEAFEVSAVDYLLKPFDEARFRATLARVRRRHDAASPGDRHSALAALIEQLERGARVRAEAQPRVLAEAGSRMHMLDVSQVEVVEADRKLGSPHHRPRDLPRPQHPAASREVLPEPADAAHQPLVPGQREPRAGSEPHAARRFHPRGGRRYDRHEQRGLSRARQAVPRASETRSGVGRVR